MGIPNIHSAGTSTAPLITSSTPPQHPASLVVGELTIAGRSYIVSIESSEPLALLPAPPDTMEKINYLVKLYLHHIEPEVTNLNDVIIEQLDENGLAYVTKIEDNDFENKMLPSSKVDFNPSNPFSPSASLPPSLENSSLISIRDVFKSIIDPLITKKEETPPPISKRPVSQKISGQRIIFQRNFEETSMKTPKTEASKVENRRAEEPLNTTPQRVEDEDNTTENQNLNEESNGFWSWTRKKLSNYVPRFFFRSKSYEVVDPSEEIKERTESFSQKHPEVQEKFRDISNLQ